ncbi:T9SS type A sorting domain-containing protein [Ancylomarina sp. YFZ004]
MRTKKYLLQVIIIFGFISNLNAQWAQIGSDINGEEADCYFGSSVCLSSDGLIIAVGGFRNDGNSTNSGHVRIYENVSGFWTQIGDDIDGEGYEDRSGSEISLSSDGSVVAIGAEFNDGAGTDAGHVRIFKNVSGTWTQIGNDIDGEASGDQSGSSVSLNSDGSIVAIGASLNDGNGNVSGHVRLFKNVSGIWTQIGNDIDGEDEENYLGRAVCLSSDGSVVAIGGHGNRANGYLSGHVKIYKNISGIWTQIGSNINGQAADDMFGASLHINSDGSIVAIGATGNDGSNGDNDGHVRVYKIAEGEWIQIGDDIEGERGDALGASVSLNSDGSVLAVGAPFNDGEAYYMGYVDTYKNLHNTWVHFGTRVYGEASGDFGGWANSLNAEGSTLAIGAGSNDGNGENSGHVRVFYNCTTFSEISAKVCDSYSSPSGKYIYTKSGFYLDTIPNNAGCDSIIGIDLSILRNEVTDTIVACGSHTWIDGNTYTTSNNTASLTLTNVHGCDSVVTLNLTINNVDVSVIEDNLTLMAKETDASYQWLDCNDNYNPIAGETSQSFTATEEGSYAVIVDNGLCIDTSACYLMLYVGINEIEKASFNIYPNPTSGSVEIDLGERQIRKIMILDISGKVIREKTHETQIEKNDISDFSSGMYIFLFVSDKKTYMAKIIKE